MSAPRGGFFRCYSCFTVIYVTRGDIQERRDLDWDSERGDLYVDSCRVCEHWRHYQPLDLKKELEGGSP
jgi:hypothetical protein